MGTGYTRNDTANNIADGNVINASDLDGEFDAIQAAFNATTGHSHDGTSGEGPQITAAGIANDAVALGTKTTGNYVAAGAVSGVGLSGSASSEGATFTVTSNATSANTASTIVARDASGNFSAGQITGTAFVSTGDMTFGDNDKAIFGAGSDLEIYHNSTAGENIIDANSGTLVLRSPAAGTIEFRDQGSQVLAQFNDNSDAKLYYNNSPKLATTSGGIDVTGTVTADGLTVSGATEFQDNPVISNGSPELTFETTNASHTNWQIAAQESLSQAFEISSGQQDADASDDTWTKRFTVSSNGDTNLYGTDNRPLAITSFNTVSNGAGWDLDATSSNGVVSISTSGAERMRVDSLGKVLLGTTSVTASTTGFKYRNDLDRLIVVADGASSGQFGRLTSDGEVLAIQKDGTTIGSIGTQKWGIGTGSPTRTLDIQGDSGTNIPLVVRGGSSQTTCYIAFNDPNTTGVYYNRIGSVGNNVVIHSNNAERMRVDSSGDLLVGKTSSSFSTAGLSLRGNVDAAQFTRSGGTALEVNRLSTNGEIAGFYKDTVKVGSIGTGTTDADFIVGRDDTFLGFRSGADDIIPHGGATRRDNAIDLGDPSYRFKDLYLSGKTYISDGGAGLPAYTFGNDTDTGIFRPTGNQIGFTTGGSERMRIDSSGNLLVGKTDTSTASQGCVLGAGGLTSFNRDNDVVVRVRRDGTDGDGIEFYNDASKVGSISLGASGTTYNTTSDIRLKTDVAPIADATDKLMAMNAVTHKWKAEPDADAVVGFIAQEMAEIVPEAVSKGEGEDDMWSMDYGRITPVLVAALQDAHKKIEQLGQRIADMEAK